MAGQETVATPRDASVYAEPRTVTDLEECYFYHSMEIPGYGLVEGPWDLRGGVDDYLGGVDLRDKRVLEVGTASGFLCFTMEGRGADVVAYDLSDKQSWDVVPYAQYDHESFDSERREHLRKLNNSWWLAPTARSSRRRRSSTGRSTRSPRRSAASKLPRTATCSGTSATRSSRSSAGCG